MTRTAHPKPARPGQVFGRWEVIRELYREKSGIQVLVRCMACGDEHARNLPQLRSRAKDDPLTACSRRCRDAPLRDDLPPIPAEPPRKPEQAVDRRKLGLDSWAYTPDIRTAKPGPPAWMLDATLLPKKPPGVAV